MYQVQHLASRQRPDPGLMLAAVLLESSHVNVITYNNNVMFSGIAYIR